MKACDYINIGFSNIGISVKKASEIIGFNSPNQLSSIRTGVEKLPKSKIFATCEALGLNPSHLVFYMMNDSRNTEDYDILRLTFQYLQQPRLTKHELILIDFVRKACAGLDVNLIDNRESPAWELSEIFKSTLEKIGAKAIALNKEKLDEISKKGRPGMKSYKAVK